MALTHLDEIDDDTFTAIRKSVQDYIMGSAKIMEAMKLCPCCFYRLIEIEAVMAANKYTEESKSGRHN
jgi:hypothetical protein